MGLAHSPSIITNGLVFAYDMANTLKSWKGAPTVNHFSIPTPDSSNNVTFSINGTGIFQRVYSGTYGGYTIQPTDVVYKYVLGLAPTGCHYHGNTISVTAGQSPTWSFDYYIDPSTTGYPVTNYLANIESSVGVGASIADPTPSIIGVWKRATQTSVPASTNGTFNAYLYPGACGSQLATGGFILYKNPQVEFNSFATPFVAGTRLANNNLEVTPSYPTWNTLSGSSYSAGTLTFAAGSYNSKGGWDLYKTYSSLSTATNYTWSALVKLGTATNFLVTMNNTSAWNTGPSAQFNLGQLSTSEFRRVSITGTTSTGSFNIHLGASANSELAATIQSGGTVFLQDVRLELTGSQTALVDLTGNNTLAATSLTYASDNTFSFKANGQRIETSINTFGNNATWEAWINGTSNVSTYNMFMGRYLPYFSFFNANRLYFSNIIGGTQRTIQTAANLSVNTWYHATFTTSYDGTNTTMKIYTNGVETATGTFAGAQSYDGVGYSFAIGDGYNATWYRFDGQVSSVKVYNQTLSAAQVQQNFNALRGRYGV